MGPWQIEFALWVTKSDLETRPDYISLEDQTKAHFLICFISRVAARHLAILSTTNNQSPTLHPV